MKELLKIRISQQFNGSNLEYVGYLVEDRSDEFIVLNELKQIELHFPKIGYKYEVLNESR
jgi:hypothetical protein